MFERMYGPIIHKQILKTIKNAPFGLYVTEEYLQKIYPIGGMQCSASDVFIDNVSVDVLEARIRRICDMEPKKTLNIGLIGSYHDNRKGIDTAIRAVVAINQKVINISLNILALGIERDRKNGMIMRQNTMSQVICFFLHHVIQLKKYWNG